MPDYSDAGEYSFKTSSGTSIVYWDEHAYATEWTQAGKESILTTHFPLIIAPKDEEMTKFYNDLKASESLNATAATIIQGISTPLQI